MIAKDMSRVGRNYLEVGFYTEVVFPQKQVRFIAIGNGVDSDVQGSNEFAPFLNIMNEYYVRDCSRKIKASIRMKGNSGKHLTSNVIYGYQPDPEDKYHWIIDEEAAAVVRRIYQLCIEGNGPFQISKILKQDKVECPSFYLSKRGRGTHQNTIDTTKPYNWCPRTVTQILQRPEYLGHTVNFRREIVSYKTKQVVENSPEDWVIFENTQEPIVDQHTWDLVQKLRKTTRRTDTIGEANPLTGLVYCADCGAKMRNKRALGKKWKSDPSKRGPMSDRYVCTTYTTAYCSHDKACSEHGISTLALRTVILDTIRYASKCAVEDEDAFREKLMSAQVVQRKEVADAIRKNLEQQKKRCTELDNLIQSLYESNFAGKISDKRFKMMSEKYEQEQEELEQSIAQEEVELQEYQASEINVEKFSALVKRYNDFEELTTPMLNEFVDKVVVHQAEKIDGERVQEVEVYLNYVGKIEIPPKELTPEELEEQEKRRKAREASRRCYIKKKEREAKQKEEEQKQKEAEQRVTAQKAVNPPDDAA